MDHSENVNREINPRENANILSVLSFVYSGKIFAKGFKKDLEDDDLYQVIEKCRSQTCTDQLEDRYFSRDSTQPGTKASIFKVILKLYGFRYFGLGLIHMTWRLLISTLEPVAISNLVAYYKPGQTEMTIYDAIYYAGLMLGLKAFQFFYFQNYFIYLTELAIQIRISFCSLIYRKALRLSPKALENTSLGNIITIITKDIQQFEQSIWIFNDVWISIVQTIIICILVYLRTGIVSFVGISMLLTVMPIQAFISKIIKGLRLKIGKLTDERLQRMQETLSTIKTIKMYTWEQIFAKKIEEARVRELKTLLKAAYSKLSLAISSNLVARFSLYAVIMMYIWMYHDMEADDIYYIIKIFGALRVAMETDFAMGFTKLGELSASLNRIDNILKLEEIPEINDVPDDKPQVHLKSVSLNLHNRSILKNISFTLEIGLNVLTGQLGCGKSCLLKTVLRDYIPDEGTIESTGRMSYASQDPWLFPSSIKQNILFGEAYDLKRYRQVIAACDLNYDFGILEKGDETILADRGMNLSKGQQARINLARAIYKESDIYLIDDALTALDTRVQENIFKNCIQGLLKNKCVLLVTHNPKHIKQADKLIVLKDGEIDFAGSRYENSEQIIEKIEQVQLELRKVDETEVEISETTKLLDDKFEIRRKQVYHEEKKSGTVDFKLYRQYVKFGGYFLGAIILVTFIVEIFVDSASQKLLSTWLNQKSNLTHMKNNFPINLYMQYSTNVSNLTNSYIEQHTTNISSDSMNRMIFEINSLEITSSYTLNLYTGSMVIIAVMELLKQYFILKMGIEASINLHKNMVDKVVRATMTFFDTFFIGNVLNRFAQDLSVVDEHLPRTMAVFVGTFLQLFSIAGLITSVNWKLIIPAIVIGLASILIRVVYIRTARSLKRLEAATRSPIVGHLNSTMEGLTTIRACKAQEILKNEFDKHQDLYTSAFYTSICVRGAFYFIMDLFSLIFVTSVIVRFLFADTDSLAGDVGLTLTQAGNLTMIITRGLMTWSDLENSMTSVERAMEYTKVESENESGLQITNWPRKGEIVYENVSLKYTNSHETILKSISFVVKPGNRIAIVGRTGAGKSSIISTLYRLYPCEGRILIDGLDLKTLCLKFLRQHISIIPQDPIMFSGTIRSNVDPLNEYTDEEIWRTLCEVKLDGIIFSLEANVADVNLSTGQRQLICLARAVIRQNKILVLDEATANMDPETERIVEQIINKHFSACTLLIIAHRLDAILDCDKVLVLERGNVVEFAEPKSLLENKHSMFAEMVRNSKINVLSN
ncbi:ATP-binding cassette sub-family C member 4-like [Diorhabda sublineata]|uniref:ATP-binding cassette sub-family C member 4-like n=1 Tax=Diorhabda sublineata TaxID=1163346 RepID=UPI0024E1284D|nr:ATP-binding cassette sub-family C member 4-like [Diorhabda sublineata]